MRVADAVANWLAEKEIFTAFGIVGGGNVVLFDAIQKKGATQIVCCHHEQAAAMASSYFNRVRGNLESVVLCTTGAGSTNTITGVMAAYMDSIPLLVISGNEPWAAVLSNTRVKGVQGYDSYFFAAPCTVFGAAPKAPIAAVNMLEYCWGAAIGMYENKRQGPVWFDLAKDIANATL